MTYYYFLLIAFRILGNCRVHFRRAVGQTKSWIVLF